MDINNPWRGQEAQSQSGMRGVSLCFGTLHCRSLMPSAQRMKYYFDAVRNSGVMGRHHGVAPFTSNVFALRVPFQQLERDRENSHRKTHRPKSHAARVVNSKKAIRQKSNALRKRTMK